MDSGNSGSIQSSSGGDEEHDSRADSISSFLSNPSSQTFTTHHHEPPPSPASFHPLSTYVDAFSRAANSNPIFSCTGIGRLVGSVAPPPYASFPSPAGPSQCSYAGNINMRPFPSPSSSSQQPLMAPPEQLPPGRATNAAAPPRGSKKRSRTSRRTPTTVLTTDTSNFRAMVQEFTGAPPPPFASSAFPRPRFDLLRAAVSAGGQSTVVPDVEPGYLLRPFPQKVPIPFASGSSSASSLASTIIGVGGSARNVTATASATAAAATSSTTANSSMTGAVAAVAAAATTVTAFVTSNSAGTTTSNTHSLPSDIGLGGQHPNLLSVLNFQSLLSPSPAAKHNSPNVPNRDMQNAPQASAASVSGYGIGGGSGRGHGSAHLGTLLPSLAASEGLLSLRGGGDGSGHDVLRWFEGSGGTDGGDQGQFRTVGGSYGDRRRGSNCKQNCTGSPSSDYLQEKGSENVPTRGEGMAESWICSSD